MVSKMTDINFEKMKKEMKSIYEGFLKNPSDKSFQKKAADYERKYGGLSTYDDYFKSKPIPEDIKKALEGLMLIYQYGSYEKNHEFSDERIISEVRKILENLKKPLIFPGDE